MLQDWQEQKQTVVELRPRFEGWGISQAEGKQGDAGRGPEPELSASGQKLLKYTFIIYAVDLPILGES